MWWVFNLFFYRRFRPQTRTCTDTLTWTCIVVSQSEENWCSWYGYIKIIIHIIPETLAHSRLQCFSIILYVCRWWTWRTFNSQSQCERRTNRIRHFQMKLMYDTVFQTTDVDSQWLTSHVKPPMSTVSGWRHMSNHRCRQSVADVTCQTTDVDSQWLTSHVKPPMSTVSGWRHMSNHRCRQSVADVTCQTTDVDSQWLTSHVKPPMSTVGGWHHMSNHRRRQSVADVTCQTTDVDSRWLTSFHWLRLVKATHDWFKLMTLWFTGLYWRFHFYYDKSGLMISGFSISPLDKCVKPELITNIFLTFRMY